MRGTPISGRVAVSMGAVVAAVLTLSAAGGFPGVQGQAAIPMPQAGAAVAQDLSESVVVTVNDDIVSTYDIIQRMRLLIVTSGIQPTEQNLPDIQREALRSLVDERLEMQELRTQGKTQKFNLIASDAEVDDELADIAHSNNTSATQLLANLQAQGVGAETFRDQLKAEISWRGWIRGRYGQRLAIGDDQIKAFEKRQLAESGKPQYQIVRGLHRRRPRRRGGRRPNRAPPSSSTRSARARPSRPSRASSPTRRRRPTAAMSAGFRPVRWRPKSTASSTPCVRVSCPRRSRSRTVSTSSI